MTAGDVIIDAHCDTLFVPFGERRDITLHADRGDVDVPRLLRAGVSCQFMAMLVNDEHGGAARALWGIDLFQDALCRCPDLLLAERAADIRRAAAEGKVAGLLALESSDALEGELAVLRTLRRLGLRSISLTHNWRNRAADGILEAETGGGLSRFGRQVVAEANDLGLILDIAHLTPAGTRDLLALTTAPVIASHSNAFAVHAHPRNLTDAQIEAVAATGGVVCVTYVDKFLTNELPTIEHVLGHLDHVIAVGGADHAGIGSDYDGFVGPRPLGLGDITELPNLAAGLRRRGYPPETVAKVMGGNLLRVIEQVCG